MKKERYTVTTEGNRTVVHWDRKGGKIEVRAATTGRFVSHESKPSTTTRETVPLKSGGSRKKKD